MRRLITAALLALALGSVQAASQMEELAQQMHPSEFPAKIEKLLKDGNPAQALELADLGIRKSSRNPQLRFMKAVALENLSRTEEAVHELQALVRDYPEIPEPYNNLAVIEAGTGNLEQALEHLNQALRINPDFALARKNLGDVYLALARESYEMAAAKLKNNRVLARRLQTITNLEAEHGFSPDPLRTPSS